jgi:transcriptional regulator with XRE-family HTH domain
MTQEVLAEKLAARLGYAVSQTFIARLEKGLVQDPSQMLLRALGAELDMSFEFLVALIAQDKYGLKPEILVPLKRSPLGLGDLAKWEYSDQHKELWIVTPRFFDQQISQLRDAVSAFLRKDGTKMTFFIGRDQFDQFNHYKSLMASTIGGELGDRFFAVPLASDQTTVMIAGYVIANPMDAMLQDTETKFPMGYKILGDEKGFPLVALKIPREVVIQKFYNLVVMRSNALNSANATASENVTAIRRI